MRAGSTPPNEVAQPSVPTNGIRPSNSAGRRVVARRVCPGASWESF
jgi:hypothetical protein